MIAKFRILKILKNDFPSVILDFPKKKYIFNIPENYQRFIFEQKLNPSKNQTIFITKNENSLGIFTLLLTSFHINEPTINFNIFGPTPIVDYIKSLEFFGKFRMKNINVYEFFTKKYFQVQTNQYNEIINEIEKYNKLGFFDNVIINNDNNNETIENNNFLNSVKNNIFQDENLIVKPLKNCLENNLSYNYICQIKHNNELTNKKIVLIDCENNENFEILIKNEDIINLQNDKDSWKVIVHIVKDDILKSSNYKNFIKNFGDKTTHLFVCETLSDCNETPVTMKLNKRLFLHQLYLKSLNEIFPNNFPKLTNIQNQFFYPFQKYKIQNENNINNFLTEIENKLIARDYFDFEINLEDLSKKRYKAATNLKVFNSYLTKNKNFEILYTKFLEKYKKFVSNKKNLLEEPELFFLGTQSAVPKNCRNLSGILINFNKKNKNNYFLLDCGDGTYYQLFNQFEKNDLETFLKDLKFIFISHSHADHHLGLINLLNKREELLKKYQIEKQLILIIPYNLFNFLSKFDIEKKFRIEIVFSQDLLDFQNKNNKTKNNLFTKNSYLQKNFNLKNFETLDEFLELETDNQENDIIQIKNENVEEKINHLFQKLKSVDLNLKLFLTKHTKQSFGISICFKNNYKIVYTGDTNYSEDIIRESFNATILIHDSTFIGNLQKQPKFYLHSNFLQAIETAMKAGVWRLVLTHFSILCNTFQIQKLKKNLRQFLEKNHYNEDFLENNTIIAIDNLKGKHSEFEYLPLLSQSVFCLKEI